MNNPSYYVFGRDLCQHGRTGILGTFSSHVAAVNAMLRLKNGDPHRLPLEPTTWTEADQKTFEAMNGS